MSFWRCNFSGMTHLLCFGEQRFYSCLGFPRSLQDAGPYQRKVFFNLFHFYFNFFYSNYNLALNEYIFLNYYNHTKNTIYNMILTLTTLRILSRDSLRTLRHTTYLQCSYDTIIRKVFFCVRFTISNTCWHHCSN